MELLVIRHAIAMEREEFSREGKSDDLRPLTAEGAKKMEKIARGLRECVKTLNLPATSPLMRARQTADIVAEAYGMGPAAVTDSLVPDAPLEKFESWCGSRKDDEIIAIVGHEPHLGELVTWLLTGNEESRIQLKKGGACLLTFESRVRRGSGRLSWLLTPRQLVRISR